MNAKNLNINHASWNVSIGCEKISAGCKSCYAENIANRLKERANELYKDGFKFKLTPQRLNEPLKNRKNTLYFINSMSDIFYEQMSFSYLDSVFEVVERSPRHHFMALTKRADIMANYFSQRDVPKNLYLGVTVEANFAKWRIEALRGLEASVRWINAEPLLEELRDLDLSGISWLRVGGESARRARRMQKSWVLALKRACEEAGVAFYFAQWGSWGEYGTLATTRENGALLDGIEYKNYPEFTKNLCEPSLF